MYKGNKGDRHAGLHYQCVIEVSGNINTNADIKVFQIKLKKRKLQHIYIHTGGPHDLLFFPRVALRLNNLDGPVLVSDSATVLAYLKKQGDTLSLDMCRVSQEIVTCWELHVASIMIRYILGKKMFTQMN